MQTSIATEQCKYFICCALNIALLAYIDTTSYAALGFCDFDPSGAILATVYRGIVRLYFGPMEHWIEKSGYNPTCTNTPLEQPLSSAVDYMVVGSALSFTEPLNHC